MYDNSSPPTLPAAYDYLRQVLLIGTAKVGKSVLLRTAIPEVNKTIPLSIRPDSGTKIVTTNDSKSRIKLQCLNIADNAKLSKDLAFIASLETTPTSKSKLPLTDKEQSDLITKISYTRSKGIVLIVNPSNENSINTIDSYLETVSEHCPDANVFVVCNEYSSKDDNECADGQAREGNLNKISLDAHQKINDAISAFKDKLNIHQFAGTKTDPIYYTRLDVADANAAQSLFQIVAEVVAQGKKELLQKNKPLDVANAYAQQTTATEKTIPLVMQQDEELVSEEDEQNFLTLVKKGVAGYSAIQKKIYLNKDERLYSKVFHFPPTTSQETVQQLVFTLALLASNNWPLKKTVFESVKKSYPFYKNQDSLVSSLTKEISVRTGIHSSVLNNLITNIADAANSNDKEKFNKALEITTLMTAHVTEYAENNMAQHKNKMIAFILKDLSLSLQNTTRHTGLSKIRSELYKNYGNEKKMHWEKIQNICTDHTTGLRNSYAKSTFFEGASRGRHPMVEIIYHAVLNPNSKYTLVIDNFDVMMTARKCIIDSTNLRLKDPNNPRLSLEEKKAIANFSDIVLYMAEKYPKQVDFQKALGELDLPKLTTLQKERDKIKILEEQVIKLAPDITKNYIKILAYNELIRQIKAGGLTTLKFEVVLLGAKWKGGEKIGRIRAVKDNDVTLKDALRWERGLGVFKTTSETICKQLEEIQEPSVEAKRLKHSITSI